MKPAPAERMSRIEMTTSALRGRKSGGSGTARRRGPRGDEDALEGADDDGGGRVAHHEAEDDVAGRGEADGERTLRGRARRRRDGVGGRLRGAELAAGGDCRNKSKDQFSTLYTQATLRCSSAGVAERARKEGRTLERGGGRGREGREDEARGTDADLEDRVDLCEERSVSTEREVRRPGEMRSGEGVGGRGGGGAGGRTLMPVLEAEAVRSDEGEERPDMIEVLEVVCKAGRASAEEGRRTRVTRAREGVDVRGSSGRGRGERDRQREIKVKSSLKAHARFEVEFERERGVGRRGESDEPSRRGESPALRFESQVSSLPCRAEALRSVVGPDAPAVPSPLVATSGSQARECKRSWRPQNITTRPSRRARM